MKILMPFSRIGLLLRGAKRIECECYLAVKHSCNMRKNTNDHNTRIGSEYSFTLFHTV
jgi:hypothetical protein